MNCTELETSQSDALNDQPGGSRNSTGEALASGALGWGIGAISGSGFMGFGAGLAASFFFATKDSFGGGYPYETGGTAGPLMGGF